MAFHGQFVKTFAESDRGHDIRWNIRPVAMGHGFGVLFIVRSSACLCMNTKSIY